MFRCVLVVALCLPLLAVERGLPSPPDLTRGGTADNLADWRLGPTGARGWIWGRNLQTSDARQILITSVAAGSPADGQLATGDVLLGIDGAPFTADARITLAKAITTAEAEPAKGRLNLLRWRGGQTTAITLTLPVLGSYAETAPYRCAKSARIFERGCALIAKRGLARPSIPTDLNALALLASTVPTYHDQVAAYAHTLCGWTQSEGTNSWNHAYHTLFLAEYALATRDASVLPGLRRLASTIAGGQSRVGTWGHRLELTGDGTLEGYGCMNQPGIVLTMALVLAREAGVQDPPIDAAIASASGFLRWYAGKGAIPYGDHAPWMGHDDNGKCASAAVLFDLLGDGDATSFFSRMAMAAYGEREGGHTGNCFSILWALPGVSRCGETGTARYFSEVSWYYDLARGWDGSCVYQGQAGGDDRTYGDWDTTGAYLLGLALPRRSLRLTGRVAPCVPPLDGPSASRVIEAGRDFSFWAKDGCYDGRSTDQLLRDLASWSPIVRHRAAQALGHRADPGLVAPLRDLLDGPAPDGRLGAIVALGCLGPLADPAVGQVRRLLTGDDPWMRSLAADAVVRMGATSRRLCLPDLLRAAGRSDPLDRRGRCKDALGEALFSPAPGAREPVSILATSLDGVDRPLLHAAIRELLANQDGRIRGLVAPTYQLLSPQDVAALLPAIIAAVRTPAPSGEMFSYAIRHAGLDLLARHRIRDGIDLAIQVAGERRWGNRITRSLAALETYGGNAGPVLPDLRTIHRQLLALKGPANPNAERDATAVAATLDRLAKDQRTPALLSAEEFMARHGRQTPSVP